MSATSGTGSPRDCKMNGLTGNGPVFALYDVIDVVHAQARKERRPLSEQEAALIAEIREGTYRMWEQLSRREAGSPPPLLQGHAYPSGTTD